MSSLQAWSVLHKYTSIPCNNHVSSRVPIQNPKWEIEKLSNKFAPQPTWGSVGKFWNIKSAQVEQCYKIGNWINYSSVIIPTRQ